MSEENVEVVRRLFEAWNRGDFGDIAEFFDPEVEFNPGLLPPGEETRYIGREGVNEWIRNLNDAWVVVTAEPEERIEVGSDRILTIDRWHFQGRDGIEIEEELPTLLTFRNGLIVRVDGFSDRADALEAAGLSEQAMSEENVEVARKAAEAITERDRTAFLAVHDQAQKSYPSGSRRVPGVRGAEAAWVFYLETFDALELWPPAFVDLRLAAQSLSSAFGMEAEVLDYWYKPGRQPLGREAAAGVVITQLGWARVPLGTAPRD